MKKLFVPVTILAIALGSTFSSCNEEEELSNIVALAESNSDLSSLVAAVERAGLVGDLSDESSSFTVFAPTNAAFDAFLDGTPLDSVPEETLRSVLLNHVLVGKVMSSDVATGYANTLATVEFDGNESNIDMFINTASGVEINGGATVQSVDLEASNGVVHVVDEVIGLPKLTTFAAENPDFSILVQALQSGTIPMGTNYVDVLNGDGPFTVFAPTNAAFEALLASNPDWNGLGDIPGDLLEDVLQYHVVTIGNVLASDLQEGQSVPTFLDGSSFTISLTGGAKITDGAGRETNIITTDIQGTNGVVHAIDQVLLPQ